MSKKKFGYEPEWKQHVGDNYEGVDEDSLSDAKDTGEQKHKHGHGHKHEGKKWQNTYVKCLESHPVLSLGGGTLIGGSCLSPTVTDADVYIGFDYGMKVLKTRPWAGEKAPMHIHYEVQDMHAPKDAAEYIELVKWTVAQLEAGKIVHAGCIGGHGRTGMFIAAVYKSITGEVDAITKVREIYCTKAVESKAQVDFLHQHFGITKAEPAKLEYVPSSGMHSHGSAANSKWKSSGSPQLELSHMKKAVFSGSTRSWSAIKDSALSVFKKVL
jgi:hypothetical protein